MSVTIAFTNAKATSARRVIAPAAVREGDVDQLYVLRDAALPDRTTTGDPAMAPAGAEPVGGRTDAAMLDPLALHEPTYFEPAGG